MWLFGFVNRFKNTLMYVCMLGKELNSFRVSTYEQISVLHYFLYTLYVRLGYIYYRNPLKQVYAKKCTFPSGVKENNILQPLCSSTPALRSFLLFSTSAVHSNDAIILGILVTVCFQCFGSVRILTGFGSGSSSFLNIVCQKKGPKVGINNLSRMRCCVTSSLAWSPSSGLPIWMWTGWYRKSEASLRT